MKNTVEENGNLEKDNVQQTIENLDENITTDKDNGYSSAYTGNQDNITEDSSELKDNNTNDKTKETIEDLKKKAEELNDKYLRLYSDFDNFRKRTIKEKAEFSKMASTQVIKAMLPVLDDFDRAIETMNKTQDFDAFKEGLQLIYNKFINTLNQQGVEELKSLGEVFDSEKHEAITNIPSVSEDQKGKIVDVLQKGYLLNGNIIRYSKVVVAN